MSHHPEETGGLDLFDETASAAGSFPHAMLGYERQAVDAYVRDVERQLSSTKRMLRSLQRQIADSQNRADDTDYGKLGAHTGDLLRAAEAQAADLVKSAQLDAERIRNTANAQAHHLLNEARLSAEDARSAGVGELQRLRAELADQTSTELAGARDQAAALRAAADQHRDMVVAEAERTADAMRQGAKIEAEQLRAEADRELTKSRAAVAKEREQGLAVIKAQHDQVSAILANLAANARQQSDEFGAKLAADSATLDQRRRLAMAEAEQITLAALHEANATVAQAKAQADIIVADAQRVASERTDQLRREAVQLAHRKQAIMTQLAGLSSLAHQSVAEFPDEANWSHDREMSDQDVALEAAQEEADSSGLAPDSETAALAAVPENEATKVDSAPVTEDGTRMRPASA